MTPHHKQKNFLPNCNLLNFSRHIVRKNIIFAVLFSHCGVHRTSRRFWQLHEKRNREVPIK